MQYHVNGECEEYDFYLAATTNTVSCQNVADSCKGTNIYCGIPSNIPSGYTSSNFDGHINECTIKLSNNAMSDRQTISCFHDIDLCQVQALSDNDDFKESTFICELSPEHAVCKLQCDYEKSCGEDTTYYTCNAPKCRCIGEGCDELSDNKISFGTAPPSTSILGLPTTSPTTSLPTITTTIEPSGNPSSKLTGIPTTKFVTTSPTMPPSDIESPWPTSTDATITELSPTQFSMTVGGYTDAPSMNQRYTAAPTLPESGMFMKKLYRND